MNNLTYTSSEVVCDKNTAIALGSGNLPVYATPAMVALMENAAMNAVASLLSEEESTVGIKIETSHLKASKIGEQITATAILMSQEGRKLSFEIEAKSGESIIGVAKHERFIINVEKFMNK